MIPKLDATDWTRHQLSAELRAKLPGAQLVHGRVFAHHVLSFTMAESGAPRPQLVRISLVLLDEHCAGQEMSLTVPVSEALLRFWLGARVRVMWAPLNAEPDPMPGSTDPLTEKGPTP